MAVQATPIEKLANPIRTCSEMAGIFAASTLCKALIVACCVWLALLLVLAA